MEADTARAERRLRQVPGHVPPELVRPFPFYVGARTRENPHALIAAVHAKPPVFWSETTSIGSAWVLKPPAREDHDEISIWQVLSCSSSFASHNFLGYLTIAMSLGSIKEVYSRRELRQSERRDGDGAAPSGFCHGQLGFFVHCRMLTGLAGSAGQAIPKSAPV
jgi:hypothetical protein